MISLLELQAFRILIMMKTRFGTGQRDLKPLKLLCTVKPMHVKLKLYFPVTLFVFPYFNVGRFCRKIVKKNCKNKKQTNPVALKLVYLLRIL